MSPGQGLYGGGTVCGWRGLGRGGRRAGEQLCISIAHPPLGLPVLTRPHYKPASGQGQSQEGGYGQQGCVIYHFIIPEEMGVGRHPRSV